MEQFIILFGDITLSQVIDPGYCVWNCGSLLI